jgi:hypothetical protein
MSTQRAIDGCTWNTLRREYLGSGEIKSQCVGGTKFTSSTELSFVSDIEETGSKYLRAIATC